jgi:hypothetical protein
LKAGKILLAALCQTLLKASVPVPLRVGWTRKQ